VEENEVKEKEWPTGGSAVNMRNREGFKALIHTEQRNLGSEFGSLQ
jgi:hypothetical protein